MGANHVEVLVKLFWAVAIGAAVGGVSRYYLSLALTERLGDAFPWGTLVINVTGSLLLGFLMRYAFASPGANAELRLLLVTGFCGGYTTFSTFSYETAQLLEDGEYARGAMYVGASVALALIGTFLGFAAANRLLALREAVG